MLSASGCWSPKMAKCGIGGAALRTPCICEFARRRKHNRRCRIRSGSCANPHGERSGPQNRQWPDLTFSPAPISHLPSPTHSLAPRCSNRHTACIRSGDLPGTRANRTWRAVGKSVSKDAKLNQNTLANLSTAATAASISSFVLNAPILNRTVPPRSNVPMAW
jgi:hypothetical protein